MNIDKNLYKLPIVGHILERTHAYFRKHMTLTDLFHVLIGLGTGLIIGSENLVPLGAVALLVGGAYHLYAFTKGNQQ